MKVTVRKLKRMSNTPPARWEGEDVEGNPIYISCYKGSLTVRKGSKSEGIESALHGDPIIEKQVDILWCSEISYDDLKAAVWDEMILPDQEEWSD